MPETESPRRRDDWRAAVILTAALTLARLVALFATPLELYPDEAQYWLWSRTLDVGYYSKPPVIAWAIWATTAIGGDAEPWVRLSAPLFQAGATLLVFLLGRRLYGPAVGLAAAALYGLMPGVQLSGLVAATDAPLLFFLGLTILAYVELLASATPARMAAPPPPLRGPPPPSSAGRGRSAALTPRSSPEGNTSGEGDREAVEGALETLGGSPAKRLWLAAGVGAALGLAFLSKYAAVYFLVGLGLHLLLSREARAAWTLPAVAAAIGAFGLLLAPNLAWNAAHHFATLQHTAANAAWGGRQLFNLSALGEFLASQFGVFGPIPFGVLIAGLALAVRRRRLERNDLLLLCQTLPPLVIVTAQAFVSRANANWSGAGYLPGAILVAAWLIRWRARRWLWAALAIQTVAATAFLAFVVDGDLANKAGMANAFKRARGWAQTTDAVLSRAAREPGLSAIAVNNRFLFYALSYYGRHDAGPPLTSWLLMDAPQNQAETAAPLTPALGSRVLVVSYEGWRRTEMEADFARVYGLEISSVWLDPRHKRRIEMFVGEAFQPRPRDPISGLPTPP